MHAHPMNQPRRTRPSRISSRLAVGMMLGIAALVAVNLGLGRSSPVTGPPASSSGATSDAIAVGRSAATSSTAPVPGSSGEPLGPTPEPTPPAATRTGPFPGGILIADRANARIVVVNNAGRIVWKFPAAGSLPRGWTAVNADDAFMSPDGKSIVANDESHETVVRIDLATKRVVWSYGHYGRMGSAAGYLHTPDDAYPLANGDIVVADIENCRILEIAPDKAIVRQWGRTGICRNTSSGSFARPNGDTPLPDGGILITEIGGSRVVRLAADGHVVFDIHVPVAYPSDAQLDARGNVVVADFSSIGQVVAVNPRTKAVVWRWRYRSGSRRLDHPSLATPLADGLISVNDDFRQRLIVIDPRHHRIVWQFGRTDVAGHGSFTLDDPDGHQPLPAGGPFGSA
jgi:outer membrane protein assembly factor BamB